MGGGDEAGAWRKDCAAGRGCGHRDEAARERDVDAVILFSGDGDFFHALDRVKQTTGKKIFVCGFRGTVSNALRRESVDHLHLIDVE
mmetsp:Transcript_41755/g.104192  ORF Transcript_41755/g.104192 Transcript_41755/m.104192 type:complete len:87 (+) Transcript_41755:623-883(+)